jgi:Secretion system C-terminal sorting domain
MRKWLLILFFTCAGCTVRAQVNIITTIGGNGSGIFGADIHDGGPATNAQFLGVSAVYSDSSGNVFLADAGNHRIRKIDRLTGVITTIAGSGAVGRGTGTYSGDGGLATDATLNDPSGLYIDKFENIYIGDLDNNRIRKVDHLSGIISTVAGNGSPCYLGDNGPATDACLWSPGQPFVDKEGNIIISDYDNAVIRKVSATTGIITTVAGTGVQGYSGDGGPATNAQMFKPYGIYVDSEKNIFVAEWGNGVIRRIEGTTGIITTVAGNGTQGYSGDSGPATAAQLVPDGVVLDRHGRMLIADFNNHRIRMVYDSTQHYVGITPAPSNPSAPKGGLHIYPNPAGNELTIEGAEGSEVSIFNTMGTSFDKVRVIKKKEVINVSSLVPGMYIIHIVGPSMEQEVRRFVKE